MKNTYRIIPTYTGDVSGAASALYELGGMSVMHDPSGCNSTYNTHDETRWYEEESLIYISGLTEVDAILGNDNKLIRDIIYAAEELKPRFIALSSAPIPYLNGTDFEGIARVLEKRTGISTFFVPTNGIHDYSVGAGNAFRRLAEKLFEGKTPCKSEKTGQRNRINILGLTPLDYDAPGCIHGMLDQLSDYEIISKWAMGSSLEELQMADSADWNLVVSVTGLKTAHYFQEKFGIPYRIGAPVTGFDRQLGQVRKDSRVYLIGEPVLMMSLAAKLAQQYGISPVVINPLEITLDGEPEDRMLWNGALVHKPVNTVGEEEVEKLIADADLILADPLYRPIAPEKAAFYAISHEAFSGRCDRKSRVNLFR